MDFGVVNEFDIRRLRSLTDPGLPFDKGGCSKATHCRCEWCVPPGCKTSQRDALPRVGWRRRQGLVWLWSRERFEDVSPRKLLLPSVDWRQRKCVMCPSCCRDAAAQRGCVGGVPCWLVLQRELTRSPFFTGTVLQGWMVLFLVSTRCREIPATCPVECFAVECDIVCIIDLLLKKQLRQHEIAGWRPHERSSSGARR